MNVRSKASYENYVCPRCFNQVHYCECYGDNLPQYLICVDKNIQKHVRLLNQKGYITVGCCESHNKYMNLHVGFRSDYGIGTSIPVPDGFTIMHSPFAISYSYDYDMSDEEFENKKTEMLDVLWEWCKALPDISC